jgi:hypothetical protein
MARKFGYNLMGFSAEEPARSEGQRIRRICGRPSRPHLCFTPDASQAQHDARDQERPYRAFVFCRLYVIQCFS